MGDGPNQPTAGRSSLFGSSSESTWPPFPIFLQMIYPILRVPDDLDDFMNVC